MTTFQRRSGEGGRPVFVWREGRLIVVEQWPVTDMSRSRQTIEDGPRLLRARAVGVGADGRLQMHFRPLGIA